MDALVDEVVASPARSLRSEHIMQQAEQSPTTHARQAGSLPLIQLKAVVCHHANPLPLLNEPDEGGKLSEAILRRIALHKAEMTAPCSAEFAFNLLLTSLG